MSDRNHLWQPWLLRLQALPLWPKQLSSKLIVLFLLIALVFWVVVGATLGSFFKHHFKHNLRPHLFQYLEFVRNDIGVPADRVKAQALADKLQIDIIIIDGRGVWSSNQVVIDPAAIRIDDEYTDNGVTYSEVDIGEKDYASMAVGDTRFLFDLSQIKHQRGHPRAVMPLVVLLLILFVLYHATRKLFAPILTIQDGVRQIGLGQLEHRIEVNRRDELGELAGDINQMAEKLQKMLDAKRQLLLAVSHELRSPLTRANVAVEMLDNTPFKQQIKEDIQEIDHLIADILETERLNSHHNVLERDRYSIQGICQDVLEDYFAKERHTLVLELPDTEVIAWVDKARIKLLLKNIIGNALRYQQQQTYVTLRVDESADDQQFTIDIRDDGPGIAETDLPHLTEPFYRVDPARQRQTGGYGLGLYLCRVITEAHGGQLHISSQLGEGTCVSVRIPMMASYTCN